MTTVKAYWEREREDNVKWKFLHKLKTLSNTLRKQSKQEFGDIFSKVKEYEQKGKNS